MLHPELCRPMIDSCIFHQLGTYCSVASSHIFKSHVCSLVGWYVHYANLKTAQNGTISPFWLPFLPSRFHFHPVVYSFLHSFIHSFIHSFACSITKKMFIHKKTNKKKHSFILNLWGARVGHVLALPVACNCDYVSHHRNWWLFLRLKLLSAFIVACVIEVFTLAASVQML